MTYNKIMVAGEQVQFREGRIKTEVDEKSNETEREIPVFTGSLAHGPSPGRGGSSVVVRLLCMTWTRRVFSRRSSPHCCGQNLGEYRKGITRMFHNFRRGGQSPGMLVRTLLGG